MKILHLSTWEERCGIATYTRQLVDALNGLGIENEVYPVNRVKLSYASLKEIEDHYLAFCERAHEFDLIHIQHEHGFFHGSYPFNVSIKIFNLILSNLKKTRKPVLVTFHTDPAFLNIEAAPVEVDSGEVASVGASTVSVAPGLKDKLIAAIRKKVAQLRWNINISKFFKKDSLFTAISHSKKSRLQLVKSGFDVGAIKILVHAFPERDTDFQEEDICSIKKEIGLPRESIVLSIFGFVSKYKGYEVAIKALSNLPSDFVLAIIGGPHPEAKEKALDDVFRTIEILSLEEPEIAKRVFITGYVETEELNKFHRATDICLAPYLPSSISASGALTWALTSGKPVVASNIPAFRELNQKANCLRLFQPTAHRELAWHVQRLTRDKHEQQALVKNAAAYVQAHSWRTTAKDTYSLYKAALEKR
ncbi:MAG: hypothetical protein DCF25_08140 [Leptolyngbya foveolarum]|uniref:Glycosyl transferase family 1 domain-containing protein n=1 Tax=Leptolyngbya foveolarum TaxID=47253 RepID=A0A2W4UK87_9CYAN|nr:MAG: hypothetical protein DCF25_08140 [Leptolyngbya foveolarum]